MDNNYTYRATATHPFETPDPMEVDNEEDLSLEEMPDLPFSVATVVELHLFHLTFYLAENNP